MKVKIRSEEKLVNINSLGFKKTVEEICIKAVKKNLQGNSSLRQVIRRIA